jgi:hypothetical protein
MIANDFIIAKDFRTYKRIILRQDKSLRDHVPIRPVGWALRDVSTARWAWDETSQRHRRHVSGAVTRKRDQPPVPAVITLTESRLTADDAHPVDL